jgi:hypothetical protein
MLSSRLYPLTSITDWTGNRSRLFIKYRTLLAWQQSTQIMSSRWCAHCFPTSWKVGWSMRLRHTAWTAQVMKSCFPSWTLECEVLPSSTLSLSKCLCSSGGRCFNLFCFKKVSLDPILRGVSEMPNILLSCKDSYGWIKKNESYFSGLMKNVQQIGKGFDLMLCIGHFTFLYALVTNKPRGISLNIRSLSKFLSSSRTAQRFLDD